MEEEEEQYLDPCCQKELIAKRNHFAIQSKLKKYDVSEKRANVEKGVFRFGRSSLMMSGLGNNCECCKNFVESNYPALDKVKQLQTSTEEATEIHSSDSEDEDLLMDDYVSESQKQLSIELHNRHLMMKKANLIGLGVHKEVSIQHILQMIGHISIVLHIYHPDSLLCGNIDLELEATALRYLGTVFRRIPYSKYTDESIACLAPTLESQIKHCDVQDGFIVCLPTTFESNARVAKNSTFATSSSVFQNDLLSFLSFSNVLNPDIPSNSDNLRNESEDDEEIASSSHCDWAGCDRNFPHEHITTGCQAKPISFIHSSLDKYRKEYDALNVKSLTSN